MFLLVGHHQVMEHAQLFREGALIAMVLKVVFQSRHMKFQQSTGQVEGVASAGDILRIECVLMKRSSEKDLG